jgi:hypothetical protein
MGRNPERFLNHQHHPTNLNLNMRLLLLACLAIFSIVGAVPQEEDKLISTENCPATGTEYCRNNWRHDLTLRTSPRTNATYPPPDVTDDSPLSFRLQNMRKKASLCEYKCMITSCEAAFPGKLQELTVHFKQTDGDYRQNYGQDIEKSLRKKYEKAVWRLCGPLMCISEDRQISKCEAECTSYNCEYHYDKAKRCDQIDRIRHHAGIMTWNRDRYLLALYELCGSRMCGDPASNWPGNPPPLLEEDVQGKQQWCR